MSIRPKPFVRILSWFRLGTVMFALLICVATIALLYFEVWTKSREINSRTIDDSIWSMAQADVEALALLSALHEAAEHQPPDLDEVRLRYDVFYSRVDTLANSDQFKLLHLTSGVEEELARLTRYFEDTVRFIDGSDEELIRQLPLIVNLTKLAQVRTRQITLTGLDAFASQSDLHRVQMGQTLSRLGMLTAAQVAILIMLILALLRMLHVGDRQAREQALVRERLEVVVGTAIDAILVVGQDGKIQDYNGAAERVFGYKRDDILGRDLAEMIIPPHLRAAHEAGMSRFLKTGISSFVGAGPRNLEAMDANGRMFPVELSVSKAQSEGGLIFIAYARDISGRLASEKALVEARDHAVAGEQAKARLLAVMSHEMRTPLNGLIGTLELLESSPLDEKQNQYVSNMQISSGLLLQHVNDVLDVSRLDAEGAEVQMSTFDGMEILDEVIESQRAYCETRGNSLNCVCKPDDLTDIRGDQRGLRQVLLNLVGNAVKFTRNGSITVETERLSENRGVEFRVIDTGQGIPEEDLQRIFDDFVTLDTSYGREAGGTGLGLGITHRLVETMGGQMGVESELGEGSLFWFRLPVATKAQRETRPRELTVDDRIGERIPDDLAVLVVEDNEINRTVAREFLELEGCRVTEAHDGQQAIETSRRQKFDLILMDISMPGMDGVEATQAIRARSGPNQQTRIVALTAHAMDEEIKRFLEAGMSQVLVKPATRSLLRMVLAGSPLPNLSEAGSRRPLVDRAALKEIRADLGPKRARQLTLSYIEETDQSLSDLCDQIEQGWANSSCADVLHRLAGSSAMFGASAIREAFLEMETLIRAQVEDLPPDQSVNLRELWARTREELQNIIEPERVN